MHISATNRENKKAPILNLCVSKQEVCINKLKSNDKNSFKLLYKLYASAINGSISRKTSDKTKREFILEQTFMNAWNNISAFDDKSCTLFIWLLRISNQEYKKLN